MPPSSCFYARVWLFAIVAVAIRFIDDGSLISPDFKKYVDQLFYFVGDGFLIFAYAFLFVKDRNFRLWVAAASIRFLPLESFLLLSPEAKKSMAPRMLVISPSSFVIKVGWETATHYWHEIRSIEKTNDYAFFMTEMLTAMVILPKRAFVDSDAFDQFVDTARNYYSAGLPEWEKIRKEQSAATARMLIGVGIRGVIAGAVGALAGYFLFGQAGGAILGAFFGGMLAFFNRTDEFDQFVDSAGLPKWKKIRKEEFAAVGRAVIWDVIRGVIGGVVGALAGYFLFNEGVQGAVVGAVLGFFGRSLVLLGWSLVLLGRSLVLGRWP